MGKLSFTPRTCVLRRPPYARVLTRPAATRRVTFLIAGMAAFHFVLTGLTILLPSPRMGYLWILSAFAVGWGTFVFESYKSRRGSW